MALKTIKYVKSGDTGATVESSRSELERILRRYGCRRIEMTRDFDEHDDEIAAKIRFSLTEMEADPPMTVPIEFRVDYWRIYEMLYGLTKGDPFDERRWNQAKRVAWRNLVLWVDGALAAAASGVKPMHECFFADIQVLDGDRQMRLADYVKEGFDQGLPGGFKGLLPAGNAAPDGN